MSLGSWGDFDLSDHYFLVPQHWIEKSLVGQLLLCSSIQRSLLLGLQIDLCLTRLGRRIYIYFHL